MTDLTARKQALLAYAQSCLEAGDYHGCRDACTDLEVIEARLQERAGRIEPTTSSFAAFATDGTPGPVVWQEGMSGNENRHTWEKIQDAPMMFRCDKCRTTASGQVIAMGYVSPCR